MAMLGPDGRPLGAGKPQASPLVGFIILRQDVGSLQPVENDKGMLAIFPTQEVAIKTARAIADAELRPNKDQKVVTPLMKSHAYVVCALPQVAVIQATIKNPSQLLAPEGQKPN